MQKTLEEVEGVLTDDVLWESYGGEISVEDVVERMAPLLEPDLTEIADELFRDTMRRAPWEVGKLKRESFHGRLLRSLTYLTTAKSRVPLNDIPVILYRLPDETKEVAQYLAAVSQVERERVQRIVERFLLRETFRPDWQEAWLYETLARTLPLSQDLQAYLIKVVRDEDRSWFVRARALHLLGQAGVGDRRTLDRAWQMAPAPFRADIIAAAVRLEQATDWASDFIEGFRGDRSWTSS